MPRSAPSRVLLVLLLLTSVMVTAPPALSITKDEVDEACAASSAAKAVYDEARAALDEATANHQAVWAELEDVAYKQLGLRATIDDRAGEIDAMRQRVVERAVDMYMAGGIVQPAMVFSAGSVEDLIAGRAFLDAATREDVASLERLEALQTDLQDLHVQFEEMQQQLASLEDELLAIQEQQQQWVDDAGSSWNDLDAECRAATQEWQRQEALRKALEAARQTNGWKGIPLEATPGFICPMPAPVSFTNDWGNPRSGGRTHKGTDVFAAMGHTVVAVANGTVRLRSGGLGGTALWIDSDYGVSFYYAHLSGYAPGIATGVYVTIGQEIAYNGNTGNAAGGAPHVHFEIHPGGSSRPAVNPYPTLAASC